MIWLLIVVLAALIIRWACRFIDRAEEGMSGTERDDERDADRDISNNLDV